MTSTPADGISHPCIHWTWGELQTLQTCCWLSPASGSSHALVPGNFCGVCFYQAELESGARELHRKDWARFTVSKVPGGLNWALSCRVWAAWGASGEDSTESTCPEGAGDMDALEILGCLDVRTVSCLVLVDGRKERLCVWMQNITGVRKCNSRLSTEY